MLSLDTTVARTSNFRKTSVIYGAKQHIIHNQSKHVNCHGGFTENCNSFQLKTSQKIQKNTKSWMYSRKMGSEPCVIKHMENYGFIELKDEIFTRWTQLENTPGVFRYKLHIQKAKILPGDYKFVAKVRWQHSIPIRNYSNDSISLFVVEPWTNGPSTCSTANQFNYTCLWRECLPLQQSEARRNYVEMQSPHFGREHFLHNQCQPTDQIPLAHLSRYGE